MLPAYTIICYYVAANFNRGTFILSASLNRNELKKRNRGTVK